MFLVYNVFTRRERMVLVRVHMHGSSKQFVFTCRGNGFDKGSMHDSRDQCVFTCREGMVLTRVNMHDSIE